MRKKLPTIAEIAKRAGVSVGTVSNVFNGKGRYTEATRNRVLEAAAELNYTPNALIRSLQRGRTHSVGIYCWPPSERLANDITSDLLRGFFEGAAEGGCDTLVYSKHAGPESDATAAMFLDGRVDGVALAPGGIDYADLAALARAGMPAVVLYEWPVPEGIASINVDNMAGIRAAIRHLCALGHQRIALYCPTYWYDGAQRARAYQIGLRECGLTFDRRLHYVPTVHYRDELGLACDHLLSVPDPPTAIIAIDDSAALLLVHELEQRGRRVPQDVSVIGFDDAPAASAGPGLTTIRQPAREIGFLAGKMLTDMLAGRPLAQTHVVMPVELVVRGTTGPAPLPGLEEPTELPHALVTSRAIDHTDGSTTSGVLP